MKEKHIIKVGSRRPLISLKKALEKVYEVKGHLVQKKQIVARIYCPQILVGHKVKLKLINDKSPSGHN